MKFKVKESSKDVVFFELREMDEGVSVVCCKEDSNGHSIAISVGIFDKRGFTPVPGLSEEIGFAIDKEGRIRCNTVEKVKGK